MITAIPGVQPDPTLFNSGSPLDSVNVKTMTMIDAPLTPHFLQQFFHLILLPFH